VNDLSDQQLLRDYSQDHCESAFAELVHRHVNLVYSVALRLLRDAHQAQDVTQAVFAALAENAHRLCRHPVLSGWLHCTARNLATKAIRSDARRREREQEAAAMHELLTIDSGNSWTAIELHLDAVLGELNAADREAVLLRYFEKKSAAEMSGLLGITDEAAQKRVNRAVERLRRLFAKRGVSVGAGGLALVISANAVQAAPSSLAATISTAVLAGSTATTTTAIAFTKTIAMTTLQKVLIGGALAVALGSGLYEASQAAQLRKQNLALQSQENPLRQENQDLQSQLASATNRLARLLAEISTHQPGSNQTELLKLRGEISRLREQLPESDSRAVLMKSWLQREDQLKQMVKQHPEKTIPELALLSEQDWLNAAKDAQFSSDEDVRHDLANLRHTGENLFASLASTALKQFVEANNGQFPSSLSDLLPYFGQNIDAAILNRWQIVPQSNLPNQNMGGLYVITEKAPVDTDLDNRWAIGPGSYGNGGGPNTWDTDYNNAIATMQTVEKAYAADNGGQHPTDPSQLQPYLTTPEQQAAYQKLMQAYGTNAAAH
jgi:RNA polymerase sigma factor (sigma-70 family)